MIAVSPFFNFRSEVYVTFCSWPTEKSPRRVINKRAVHPLFLLLPPLRMQQAPADTTVTPAANGASAGRPSRPGYSKGLSARLRKLPSGSSGSSNLAATELSIREGKRLLAWALDPSLPEEAREEPGQVYEERVPPIVGTRLASEAAFDWQSRIIPSSP